MGFPYMVAGDPVNQIGAGFQALATSVDNVYGLEYGDFLQPGVVGNATLPNASGPTINSSTGVVTVTLNADVAWVSVSGTLTRCQIPTSATPLTPSSLPTSPNYRCMGVYVAPSGVWGTTGNLSQAVGISQSTAAGALANPPSTPAGTLLVEYVVIGNASAVYSIASTTDERVFANYGLSSAVTPWTAYTPLWSTTGTPPAIGNGTLIGAYRQMGKTVLCRFYMLAGSTTTFGTGGWRFTLPFAIGVNAQSMFGVTYLLGGATNMICASIPSGSITIALYTSAAVVVDATHPVTFAANSELTMQGVYESA